MLQRVILICFALIHATSALAIGNSFKQDQLRYPRVKVAYLEKAEYLKELYLDKGISYPPEKIYIRIFKKQKILELWSWSSETQAYVLIKSYGICYASGSLGPKRKEGDHQVPEGFYHIDRFNPNSSYFLSLRINYPNQSDKKLGHKTRPGGDIFIHGDCVSVGCIAITDDKIKEIYVISLDARNNGQNTIPVHIYPSRLDDEEIEELRENYKNLHPFWLNLKQGYDIFEENRKLPNVRIDRSGKYIFSNIDVRPR
ncbi:MAG: L,D-transpeptidase family protein [Thermodesulfobacteriota bacterium]